jgi:xanthine dehydrogenase accessory factor
MGWGETGRRSRKVASICPFSVLTALTSWGRKGLARTLQEQRFMRLSQIKIGIRGGGDIASGVAWRLHQCGFRIFITEIDRPLAVRRTVAFCEAVYDGRGVVEGVEAVLVRGTDEIPAAWKKEKIAVMVDPTCQSIKALNPEVLVDAILAKKNSGTSIEDAPLVIALGPGFEAGRDAHFVVETNRGHRLGRLLTTGSAEPDTGRPGAVLGITSDRVLRAPADGAWRPKMGITEFVKRGDPIGEVSGVAVQAEIDGVLRGLIRPGIEVSRGLKIGDIDPRGIKEHCYSISDKALAVSGGVLEGILRVYAG